MSAPSLTHEVEEPPAVTALRVAVVHNLDFSDESAPHPRLDRQACEDVVEVAAHVSAALNALGCEAMTIPVRTDLCDLLPTLHRMEVAAVFNLVESLAGDSSREPELPAMLLGAGTPFTGNRAAALRCAQNKHTARRLLRAGRVPIPPGVTVTDPERIPGFGRAKLDFPVFVKPARQDASVGIDQGSIAHDLPQLRLRLARLAATVPGPWLIEGYLPGREFNVAFFPSPQGRACLSEVDFSGLPPSLAPIVTYDCKWVLGSPEYDVVSRPCGRSVPARLRRVIVATAREALLAVGADGYCRVDLRLDADGLPRVIDVNPNPDLHPDAGFARSAVFAGFSYPQVIGAILHHAMQGSAHELASRFHSSVARPTSLRPRPPLHHPPADAAVLVR